MITFTLYEWRELKERMATDYGRGVLLLRDKTKRELGFTVREHHDTDKYRRTLICLDFYDDAKETMFRLKYL
jgi:ribosomal protein L34